MADRCEAFCAVTKCSYLSGHASECLGCTSGECHPGSAAFVRPGAPPRCPTVVAPFSAHGRFGQTSGLYSGLPPRSRSPSDCLRLKDDALRQRGLNLRCEGLDVEDVSMLGKRGWVVVRSLMPRVEAASLAQSTPKEWLCRPTTQACWVNGRSLPNVLPGFSLRLSQLFDSWSGDGVAEAASLGRNLRVSSRANAARRIHITPPTAWDAMRARDAAAFVANNSKPYSTTWHVDNSGNGLWPLRLEPSPWSLLGLMMPRAAAHRPCSTFSLLLARSRRRCLSVACCRADGFSEHFHRVWVLLSKGNGDEQTEADAAAHRNHTNVCVLPSHSVDACDTPKLRRAAMQQGAMLRQLYDRLACCPELDVGDAIFYREEVTCMRGSNNPPRFPVDVLLRPS